MLMLRPVIVAARHGSSPAPLPLCPRFSAMMSFSGLITWQNVSLFLCAMELHCHWGARPLLLFEEIKLPELQFMCHKGCTEALHMCRLIMSLLMCLLQHYIPALYAVWNPFGNENKLE